VGCITKPGAQRGEKGGTIPLGTNHYVGVEWLRGSPKSPNNVTSTSIQYICFRKTSGSNMGGAKLASFPGRHITSLRLWTKPTPMFVSWNLYTAAIFGPDRFSSWWKEDEKRWTSKTTQWRKQRSNKFSSVWCASSDHLSRMTQTTHPNKKLQANFLQTNKCVNVSKGCSAFNAKAKTPSPVLPLRNSKLSKCFFLLRTKPVQLRNHADTQPVKRSKR